MIAPAAHNYVQAVMFEASLLKFNLLLKGLTRDKMTVQRLFEMRFNHGEKPVIQLLKLKNATSSEVRLICTALAQLCKYFSKKRLYFHSFPFQISHLKRSVTC